MSANNSSQQIQKQTDKNCQEDDFLQNENPCLHFYLNTIQTIFDRIESYYEKYVIKIKNIPDINSKILLQITCLLSFLTLAIFFVSCQTKTQYDNRVSRVPLPSSTPAPSSQIDQSLITKEKEQLYIKRENLLINKKERGSSTGSIWADADSPKSLATEFKPSRPGDIITVNIPADLQFKENSPAPNNNTTTSQGSAPKANTLTSYKFQVVGLEPGGDVYLRGMKKYTSSTGEQRHIVVLAKVPRRNMQNSEINAADISEVSVNEDADGQQSSYTSTGWDQTISRKLSDYPADTLAQTAKLEEEKKEIDTQKKSLAERQKSLGEEAERLKKDRARLEGEKALAKKRGLAAPPMGNSPTSNAAQPPASSTSSPTQPATPPVAQPNQATTASRGV